MEKLNEKQVIMPLSEYRGWEFSKSEYEKEIEKLSLQNQELAKTAREAIESAVCENGDIVVIEYETVCVGKVEDRDPYRTLHSRGSIYKNLYERVPRFLGKDEVAAMMDKHYQILAKKINDIVAENESIRKTSNDKLKKLEAENRFIDNRIWDNLTPKEKKRVQNLLLKGEKRWRKK